MKLIFTADKSLAREKNEELMDKIGSFTNQVYKSLHFLEPYS